MIILVTRTIGKGPIILDPKAENEPAGEKKSGLISCIFFPWEAVFVRRPLPNIQCRDALVMHRTVLWGYGWLRAGLRFNCKGASK